MAPLENKGKVGVQDGWGGGAARQGENGLSWLWPGAHPNGALKVTRASGDGPVLGALICSPRAAHPGIPNEHFKKMASARMHRDFSLVMGSCFAQSTLCFLARMN